MSSEVEVLEGGVSKEAVFGGQERGDQGGDDVRVVREVTRPDKTGRPEDVDLPRLQSAILTSSPASPLSVLNIRVSTISQRPIYIDELSCVCQAKFTRYTDQVTNKFK